MYSDVTVPNHLIHDALHMFHDIVSFGLSFQLAEFVFLSCYHFVVANAHLLQQCLFIGFCRLLPIPDEKTVCLGIHFGASLFYKWGIGLVELQLTLHQVIGLDEHPRLHRLMHTEKVRHEPVTINRQPVSSVKVARQGEDVIVLSGGEAGLIAGTERDDGTCVFNVIHRRLSLYVLFDIRRTCQRVSIDTLQLYLCYPRKPGVELDSTADCRITIISAVFVRLDG